MDAVVGVEDPGQLADGGARDDAVDDHADARRDQKGNVAGIDDQRQGERILVAGLEHARAQRRPHRYHGGLGRTRDRAEQGAGGSGADGKAALDVADEAHDHVDQAVSRLAAGHDVGGEDEHRHGDQRRGPDAAHHLLDEGFHLTHAAEGHVETDEGRRGQGNHHRKPQQQQHDHDGENDGCHGYCSLSPCVRLPSRYPCSRRPHESTDRHRVK